MLKKVFVGILVVFCATVLVFGINTEAFATSYPCKSTTVGSSGGGSPSTTRPVTVPPIAEVKKGDCTSILPSDWCNGEGGIMNIATLVVTILTGAVVVAGTIGIIFCGIIWMTARDNEAQVAKAKKRMFDIVVGLVAWVLLALIINLLIPKSPESIKEDAPGISKIIQRQNLMTEPVLLTTGGRDGYCSMKPTAGKVLTPASASSVDVACADGTEDLGIEDRAYMNGNKTTIRLCSIPNIKDRNYGTLRVSSRASAAFYALGEAYYKATGLQLSASESFRTYEMQEYYWKCYKDCTCNNCNEAAYPGNSKHQSGLAVDFDMVSGVEQFFANNLDKYGLARNVAGEPWHVTPK